MAAGAGDSGPHQDRFNDLGLAQARVIALVSVAIVEWALAAELAIPDFGLALEIAEGTGRREMPSFSAAARMQEGPATSW
jgi:hypothetical protein